MTLGGGIFLSALVLSLTALFIATKDRWNWKKILLWPTAVLVGIAILVGGWMYVISLIPTKPSVEESFWGINLNSSMSDIKFKKGNPTKSENEIWAYEIKKEYDNDWSLYIISFRDEKIRYIMYKGSSRFDSPYLQGIRLNDSSHQIRNVFGEPTHTSISDDQLQRIYSYDNYHVFFELERDEVQGYGIFDPAFGPLQFKKKSETNKNQ